MNIERLRVYVTDHLAMIVGERELAVRTVQENAGTPLAEWLSRFISDIDEQSEYLREILTSLGGQRSTWKEGAAWLMEKVGRLKMNDQMLSYSDLSRLIELEGLSAAIEERVCLWSALGQVLADTEGYEDVPFEQLREKSFNQRDELAAHRAEAARIAFVQSQPVG